MEDEIITLSYADFKKHVKVFLDEFDMEKWLQDNGAVEIAIEDN